MEIQYIRNKKFILRGLRCHCIPMENTKLLFIRGIRFWPEIKMRRHLRKTLKELNIKVLSVKRIANFNDEFFKIKIVGNEEEITSITECIVNSFNLGRLERLILFLPMTLFLILKIISIIIYTCSFLVGL